MQYHVRTGVNRFIGAALAALFVVIALVGPVSAATTGTISGTLVDTVQRVATRAGRHGSAGQAHGPRDRDEMMRSVAISSKEHGGNMCDLCCGKSVYSGQDAIKRFPRVNPRLCFHGPSGRIHCAKQIQSLG